MHQLKNGMKKAKMQLAAKLLQNGSTIQYVADLTELPEETIHELAQNMTSKKILEHKWRNPSFLSVTVSQYRNMISASSILSIILLIFHKRLCSN